jgi:hypothetical protein
MASAGATNNLYAKFVGGPGPAKISNTVNLGTSDNYQHDVSFFFNPPVDVDTDLCANGGNVKLEIYATEDSNSVLFYGSTQSTYTNGALFGFPTLSPNTDLSSFFYIADLYFIINGHVSDSVSPTLTPIPPQTTTEGQSLTFTVSATDPDNDTVTLSAENLPTGATFNPTTGEFTWTPDFNDEGTYNVTFTATENTPEALSTSTTANITIINYNRPPELSPIGNQTVAEGDVLEFTVSATDPDGDEVTLSAQNLPTGATFNPVTGIFTWNTDFDDAGNYENIEFTATDNGTPMELDVELITVTVGNVNRLPELANPGPQTVIEEETVSFTVSATDPDNDAVALSATNLPSGATFNSITGTFTWSTTLSDAGVYVVTVTATDNGTPAESASTEVVITVGDNPTPTEQAEDLIETVVTIDIPQNVENSYLANLQKVGQFIQEGKITAALNQLNAFINKITTDYNQGILTQVEYEQLLGMAQNLINDLN